MTASSSSPSSSLGLDILLSLPPMEDSELETVKRGLVSVKAFDNEQQAQEAMRALRTKTCCQDTSDTAKPALSPLAQAVSTKVQEYVTELYGSKRGEGIAARWTVTDDENNINADGQSSSVVAIRTYVEKRNTANKMVGAWTCRWACRPASETDVVVTGSMEVHAACGESGTCHLLVNRTYPVEGVKVSIQEEQVNSMVAKFEATKLSYDEKVANRLVEFIRQEEAQLFEDLKHTYYDASDTNLKKLRRILPITKTRFKWDVAAQKQVTLLNARKQQQQPQH